MWPVTLSGRLLIVGLVGLYPANCLIRRELTLHRLPSFTSVPCDTVVLCGISNCFQLVSPFEGQIVHALLTRPPLEYPPKGISSFDLHVLSTPPAFVLSQDQTLVFNPYRLYRSPLRFLPPSGAPTPSGFSPQARSPDAFNSFSESTVFSCVRSLYRFQGPFVADQIWWKAC